MKCTKNCGNLVFNQITSFKKSITEYPTVEPIHISYKLKRQAENESGYILGQNETRPGTRSIYDITKDVTLAYNI